MIPTTVAVVPPIQTVHGAIPAPAVDSPTAAQMVAYASVTAEVVAADQNATQLSLVQPFLSASSPLPTPSFE